MLSRNQLQVRVTHTRYCTTLCASCYYNEIAREVQLLNFEFLKFKLVNPFFARPENICVCVHLLL